MSSDSILEIDGVTKKYRSLVAVDDVTFRIPTGEFVGMIGPNGAGKSTTMGCIAGTASPDEGTVRVDGVEVTEEPTEARRHLGFVPQHPDLLDYLTGGEYLDFIGTLRGLEEDELTEQVDELLDLAELDEARDTILKNYSGGMLRKLAVSAALVGSPPLLVLDESFVGLDPESTHRFRQKLRAHCEEGGAILLSSHILEMLETLCDRFVILHQGRLAEDVSREDFEAMKRAGEFENLTELYLETTGKSAQ